MDKELQSLLEGIETANNLQSYEEDFMGIGGAFKVGAKAVGNAAKNAWTNTKNAASNLNQSLNAKAQNANAKGDFVQQQKELDQQLQTFANNLSGLLTKNASGSQQKNADKQADKASKANSALNKAKKNTQDEVDKTAEEMKNASTNEGSDSSTAAPANNGGK